MGCDGAACAASSPPHLDLGFAHGLGFTTVHGKIVLRGVNVRDTDCRCPKYYPWLASFCC